MPDDTSLCPRCGAYWRCEHAGIGVAREADYPKPGFPLYPEERKAVVRAISRTNWRELLEEHIEALPTPEQLEQWAKLQQRLESQR